MGRWLALGTGILFGCAALFLLLSHGGEDRPDRFTAFLVTSPWRRRLAVSSPSFSLQQPSGGNLPNVPSNSGNVLVVAGPTYSAFTIQAPSGLGNNGNVRIKLVASITLDCSSAEAMGVAPLDGSAAPSIRTASLNTFSNVRFIHTGVFKVCYKSDLAAVYELLPVTITVSGGISSDEHFCAATLGAACVLKVAGSSLGSLYKIGVVPHTPGAACGASSLDVAAFNNPVSELIAGVSTPSMQVHSFSSKNVLLPATYLLCLCPNFDADSSGSACQGASTADFAQPIGRLFVTTVSANIANIYSGLGFNLIVNCGMGVGGCMAGAGSRYKIADHSLANDAPAWNSSLGCGAAQQTSKQIRPANCGSRVMCQHNPDAADTLQTTWYGVALRSSMLNARYVTTVLDVCYCDLDCLTTERWFKVGEITILPVTVGGPAFVNAVTNLELSGLTGSWATSGNVLQREMKMLPDSYGAVTDAQCYEVEQSSSLVQGHTCTSAINCKPPTSGVQGQTYIGVGVRVPGWVAVCYCDRHCDEHGYWMVQGHLLVAGPTSGQSWFFYTSAVFDLEVNGWALTTANRIRIIDWSLQCDSLGVAQASAVLGPSPLEAEQSSGAAGSISAIAQHGLQTKVTFAAHHGLSPGTRISITGLTCGTCAIEDRSRLNANHDVKTVLSPSEILIALSFTPGSYPAVITSGASWLRDDLQTFRSVKALASGDYRVCWRASYLTSFAQSACAGKLRISSAPVMPTRLFLSTIEPTRVAPIVVSFTTSSNKRYEDAVGPMQLKLVFLQPSLLMPALFNGSLASVDTGSLDVATQSICSLWILELGTGKNDKLEDNELGFPMPRGCYYKQEGSTWAFHVVFDPRNGLAPSQTYDIVMNGVVGAGLTTAQEVLQVDSFDDSIRKQFDVIESGRAMASKGAATVLRSGNDAEFHYADGFRILGDGDGVMLQLNGSRTSFQARLRSSWTKPILAESIIRLFMFPLTQWIVGYSCHVSCTPYSLRVCGVPLCLTESVMKRWYHRNMLTIHLPKGMANITHIVKHDLEFTSVPTPPGGFFPLRWGVELQAAEGQKPHYVETTGKLVFIQPAATVAAIVTSIGDGNLKPFYGQSGNELYLKLILGATLFAMSPGDAFLRIVLPNGYSCVSGVAAAPQNLVLLTDMVPNRKGNLTNDTQAVIWRSVPSTAQSSAYCELHFGAKMVFYAGTTAYFTISVDNPSFVLAQDAPGNQWGLELAAMGAHSSAITMPLVNFAGAGPNLSSSVSVLGKLSMSSLVPSDFARASSSNWLSIFFTTAQAVPFGGAVWVEGPSGFGFGKVCQVLDLPSYQYRAFDVAFIEFNSTNTTPLTLRLPHLACTGMSLPTSTSINRAQVKLSSRLLQGASYGFLLRVTNPEAYLQSQQDGWRISTRTSSGNGIDGSLYSIQLNAGEVAANMASWGMYEYHIRPSGFEAHVADMRPSGVSTKVQILPITLWRATNSPMRIIAPAGYIWSFSSSDFIYRKRAMGLSPGAFVPGVEADMPLGSAPAAPTAVPYNVLKLEHIVGWFRWGVKYGFEARIIVPQHTPTLSVNQFILQVGYNQHGPESASMSRSQAAVTEAELVRRIADVVVAGFTSSIRNASNNMVLHFRTLAEIPTNGGLVISGPSDFVPMPNVSCQLKVRAGASSLAGASQPLPLHSCRLGNFSGVGLNASASILAHGPILAASYELHLSVRNPTNTSPQSSSPGVWSVVSYESLSTSAPEIVDYEGTAPSFRINTRMQTAAMVSGSLCVLEDLKDCAVVDQQYRKTGRDDRPGATNNLIFSFSLSMSSTPGQFVIRAPLGFVWAVECAVAIVPGQVFGAFNKLPANFSQWPDNATVSNCRGHENVAIFQVSHPHGQGLLQNQVYVLRVDSVTNPRVVPAVNLWSLEFSGQSSPPFSGFTLWTISASALTPHTTAEGFSNDVTLTFATYNAVPSLGYVEIEAPGGFKIPFACLLSISTVVPAKPWEINKLFLPGDYNCTGLASGGQPTSVARVFFLRKSLLAGLEYTFHLAVINPSVAPPVPGSWYLSSFWEVPWITNKKSYDRLDSTYITGFPINSAVGLFELRPTPQLNGLANVSWRFSMIFREEIYASDRVEFEAPSEYFLQANSSSSLCSQYELLLGLKGSNTSCHGACFQEATCVNSTMVWNFHRCLSYTGPLPLRSGLCLPADSSLQFAIATQNPATTPASNFFFVNHVSLSGSVQSSTAISGYPIIPLLGDPKVELQPAGALGVISEAVGSESSIRITFTPTGVAQTVAIQGAVAGQSFRFSSCSPKVDATKVVLMVNEREFSKIIVTLPTALEVGEPMSILLEGMGNPAQAGVSSWNVTTYQYYDPVLGPRFVINQKTGIVGLEVLGYISVLSTSTLRPKYYGKKGATLSLSFQTSLEVLQGDDVLLIGPTNYAFDSNLFNISGVLAVANVRLVGPSSSAASAFIGSYSQVSNVNAFQATYLSAGGTLSDMTPIYKSTDGSSFLYKLPGGMQWAIGPVPGQTVNGASNEALLNEAALVGQASWQVGSGSNASWLSAGDVYVTAEGSISEGFSQLAFRLGRPLSAASTAVVHAMLSLPIEEQDERNWRLSARRGVDNKVYATNDMQYAGFSLFWEIAFQVVPALTAPKAQTTLSLAFDQLRPLMAQRSVRYELTAPSSFRFPAACLSVAERQMSPPGIFAQCVGSSNVAAMIATDPSRIKGRRDTLKVELTVVLPEETPLMNTWTLAFFLDVSSVNLGFGEGASFNIAAMPTTFKGSNQLSLAAPAYFTIRPWRPVEVGSTIHLLPPSGRFYKVSCYLLQKVNLPALPTCSISADTGALVLSLEANGKQGGGRLDANVNYTMGIGVTNAGRTIPDAMNWWTVVIRDSAGNIQDANYQVPGERLRSIRIRALNNMVSEKLAGGDYRATAMITLSHDLAAGLVTVLHLIPPSSFTVSSGLWKVSAALPAASVPRLENGVLVVPLATATLPRGSHSIQVTGSFSGITTDSTWTFQALRGDEVIYQHVMVGLLT